VETLELKHADALKIDAMRAQEGEPLIRQVALFFADDPWQQIAQAMLPAIQRAFPTLQDDLAKLGTLIQKGEINLFDYFKEFPAHTEKAVEHWTKDKGVKSASLLFLLKSAMRILLEKRRQSLDWKDVTWEKGYCPVCGTLPTIATIQEKIAEQWLHCSACGHDWKYERLICPGCEHEGQQETNFFFVEDKEREAAFVCDACKRYMITLNRITDINVRDLDLSAISLVHLDVLMQEKGFQPLCVSEWNIF
jgi:FdhE protein